MAGSVNPMLYVVYVFPTTCIFKTKTGGSMSTPDYSNRFIEELTPKTVFSSTPKTGDLGDLLVTLW